MMMAVDTFPTTQILTAATTEDSLLRMVDMKFAFEQLFSLSTELMCVIDYDGFLKDVNPAWTKLLGYKRHELVGKPFINFVHPQDRDASLEVFSQVINGVKITTFENRYQGMDSSFKWLLWNGTPDPERQVIYATAMDITDRKHALEVEQEQRILAEALHDISVALLSSTLDIDDVFDRVLDHLSKIIPYDTASVMLVETGFAHVTHCRGFDRRDIPTILSMQFDIIKSPKFRTMLKTGQPVMIADIEEYAEWQQVDQINSLPSRSYLGAPIRVDGQLIGFINLDSWVPGRFTPEHIVNLQLFSDHVAIAIRNANLYDAIRNHATELERRVAERTESLRQAQDELRAALEKEQELNQVKSRLVSMANHEIKNPLAVILSSASMMKRYSDRLTDERKQHHIDNIISQVQHLSDLVDEMLLISRAQTVGIAFDPAPMDLDTFCQQRVSEARNIAGNTHEINFSLIGDHTQVNLDAKLLHHIVSNLLSNAVKYSPSGSKVQLDVRCDTERVIIHVHDEGIGIPDEDLARLFDMFHRARNVGQTPGSGLGLAIVKQAVEAHNGTISVDSRIHIGTTFTVVIPATSIE